MTGVGERFSKFNRRIELSSPQRAGAHGRRLIRKRRKEVLRKHWRFFALAPLIAAVTAGTAQLFLPEAAAPYVVGGIVVAAAWSVTSILHSIDGMANHRLGIAGEQWTADELRRLRKQGWRFVNHVMLENTDVDHAMLGPGGFFAIDTKYRTNWASGTGSLDALAASAQWQAGKLQPRLGSTTPRVEPLVVLWGPRASEVFDEVFEHSGVTFCLGSEVYNYLASREATVDDGTVERAFETLDSYVAKRDVGEAREHGDPARSISEHAEDIGAAIVGASAVFLALIYITLLPPAGVWTIVLAGAIAAGSFWARRVRPDSERVLRATAATLATSLGFGGIVFAVIVINLIWSG